ncbi:MAG: alpha/beta hydrolase [Pseudomonas sp.]
MALSADALEALNQRRRAYDGKGALVALQPSLVAEPTLANGVPVEITVDSAAQTDITIFYAHGGGGSLGSIDSHRGLVGLLGMAARARTISVGYRLAPEHVFPAGLEDVYTAYRWLIESGTAVVKLVVAGDSAGCTFILSTLMQARADGLPMPAAAVLLSPMVDQTAEAETMDLKAGEDRLVTREGRKASSAMFIGNTDRRDPRLSPLFGDFMGLPPLYIQVGTAECLLDDALFLARNAMLANVEVHLEGWPNMQHVWHLETQTVPEAAVAIEAAGLFIRDRLSRS